MFVRTSRTVFVFVRHVRLFVSKGEESSAPLSSAQHFRLVRRGRDEDRRDTDGLRPPLGTLWDQ